MPTCASQLQSTRSTDSVSKKASSLLPSTLIPTSTPCISTNNSMLSFVEETSWKSGIAERGKECANCRLQALYPLWSVTNQVCCLVLVKAQCWTFMMSDSTGSFSLFVPLTTSPSTQSILWTTAARTFSSATKNKSKLLMGKVNSLRALSQTTASTCSLRSTPVVWYWLLLKIQRSVAISFLNLGQDQSGFHTLITSLRSCRKSTARWFTMNTNSSASRKWQNLAVRTLSTPRC